MPILFILWKVIANYEFGQGFLWIPDLALPDPYYILPVLYVASTFLSTWLSAHGNRDLIRQSLFMNLIFVFLVLQFPSGSPSTGSFPPSSASCSSGSSTKAWPP